MQRRRGSPRLRAIFASSLLHGGLVAWAAQMTALSMVTWSVESGASSVASIEASFSEGDLDATPVPRPVEQPVLHLPKSTERTSPEETLVVGSRSASRLIKQPAEAPPPPAPSDQGALPPVPVAPPLPHAERSPTPGKAPSLLLASVPRVQRAAEVQVEPIEPAVASSPANASAATSGSTALETPQALTNPAPQYPAAAQAAGVTGRVLVRVRLSDTGSVTLAELYRSSGSSILDTAAVEGVQRWRFEPPTANKLREFAVPVNFVLGGSR